MATYKPPTGFRPPSGYKPPKIVSTLPKASTKSGPVTIEELRSQNDKSVGKLVASGIKPPQRPNEPTFWEHLFGILGAPAAGVQTAIYNVFNDGTGHRDKNILDEMGKSLSGKREMDFKDITSDLLNWDPKSGLGKAAKGVVDFAGEMVTDPLNLLGPGTTAITKEFAKAAAVEIATHGLDLATAAKYGLKGLDLSQEITDSMQLFRNADDQAKILKGLFDWARKDRNDLGGLKVILSRKNEKYINLVSRNALEKAVPKPLRGLAGAAGDLAPVRATKDALGKFFKPGYENIKQMGALDALMVEDSIRSFHNMTRFADDAGVQLSKEMYKELGDDATFATIALGRAKNPETTERIVEITRELKRAEARMKNAGSRSGMAGGQEGYEKMLELESKGLVSAEKALSSIDDEMRSTTSRIEELTTYTGGRKSSQSVAKQSGRKSGEAAGKMDAYGELQAAAAHARREITLARVDADKAAGKLEGSVSAAKEQAGEKAYMVRLNNSKKVKEIRAKHAAEIKELKAQNTAKLKAAKLQGKEAVAKAKAESDDALAKLTAQHEQAIAELKAPAPEVAPVVPDEAIPGIPPDYAIPEVSYDPNHPAAKLPFEYKPYAGSLQMWSPSDYPGRGPTMNSDFGYIPKGMSGTKNAVHLVSVRVGKNGEAYVIYPGGWDWDKLAPKDGARIVAVYDSVGESAALKARERAKRFVDDTIGNYWYDQPASNFYEDIDWSSMLSRDPRLAKYAQVAEDASKTGTGWTYKFTRDKVYRVYDQNADTIWARDESVDLTDDSLKVGKFGKKAVAAMKAGRPIPDAVAQNIKAADSVAPRLAETTTEASVKRGKPVPEAIKREITPAKEPNTFEPPKPGLRAKDLTEAERQGECYSLAYRELLSDRFPEGSRLVHGRATNTAGERIHHAWIETPEGKVWDPVSNRMYAKKSYYRANSIAAEASYETDDAMMSMARNRHMGPWHESAEDLAAKPILGPPDPEVLGPSEMYKTQNTYFKGKRPSARQVREEKYLAATQRRQAALGFDAKDAAAEAKRLEVLSGELAKAERMLATLKGRRAELAKLRNKGAAKARVVTKAAERYTADEQLIATLKKELAELEATGNISWDRFIEEFGRLKGGAVDQARMEQVVKTTSKYVDSMRTVWAKEAEAGVKMAKDRGATYVMGMDGVTRKSDLEAIARTAPEKEVIDPLTGDVTMEPVKIDTTKDLVPEEAGTYGPRRPGAELKKTFQYQNQYANPEAAIIGGQARELNLATLAGNRVAGSGFVIEEKKLRDLWANTFGDGDFNKIPEAMKKEFDRVMLPLTKDSSVKDLQRFFDGLTSIWRKWATVLNLGFMSRNMQSNMYLAWAHGYSDLDAWKTAVQIASGTMADDAMIVLKVKGGGTFEKSVKELREMMLKNGVIGGGQTREITDDALRSMGTMFDTTDPTKRLLALAGGGPAAKLGTGINAFVEDSGRISVFLQTIKRGAPPAVGARMVNRTLYDYGVESLTSGEQALRTWIPFYTFARRNIPEMLSVALHDPSRVSVIDKMVRTGPEVDTKNMPEYMRDMSAIPLPFTDKPMLFNANWGYQDIAKLESLFKAAKGDLKPAVRDFMAMVNPFAKVLLEIGTNKDFYFGGDLAKYEGELTPAPGYLQKLDGDLLKGVDWWQDLKKKTGSKTVNGKLRISPVMNKILSTNPWMANLGRAMEDSPQRNGRIMSWVAGIKTMPVEEQKWELGTEWGYRQSVLDALRKAREEGLIQSVD